MRHSRHAHAGTGATGRTATATGWLDAVLHRVEAIARRCQSRHHVRVLPCFIEGRRALVHEQGLADREPLVFAWLRRLCDAEDIRLQEDRRSQAVPVSRDRRRRLAPVLAIASSMLAPAALPAADAPGADGETLYGAVAHLPVRDEGRRFMSGPHGEVDHILRVAAETRRRGEAVKVSAVELQVPDRALNNILTRYDYRFPEDCGGQRFSYYEGHDFRALGHHQGDKVVVDVLVGGGPFTAPRLWGPYDQVLNDSVDMQMLVGSGEQDSFGLMKASYTVGLVARLPEERRDGYGDVYRLATAGAGACELAPAETPQEPTAPRQHVAASGADTDAPGRMAALVAQRPADDTRSEEVSAPAGSDLYGAADHLPVRNQGKRFVATPQGDIADIEAVAAEVRRLGRVATVNTRQLKLPMKHLNPTVLRYDHVFETASGPLHFSLYEGRGLRALGLHDGERVVLDVLEGGALSAPRLWGTYDQVLNDDSQLIDALIADGERDGFGMLKAAFVVGAVSRMPESKREAYGRAYAEAVDAVARELPEADVAGQVARRSTTSAGDS